MLERLKRNIVNAAAPRGMSVKIVAIDGYGGSGKSSLARKLGEKLSAEVIHTDDFASWDNPLDWWPRLMKEVIDPIKNGAQFLSYKRGSWYKNHNPKPVHNQPVTPILLLEGVSSARKEFRPFLAYAVWVETPLEVCMKRGIERDLADNPENKPQEEIVSLWKKWHSYEQDYVKQDSPRQYAGTIVEGTKEYQ